MISTPKIIAKSPAILNALHLAKTVAPSTANILIGGESGTGKEVLAQYIHCESKRKSGPFIPINCSAIPEHLLESELFGHARGAFTGAVDSKIGLFEAAEKGTFFLDEIGDLSMPLQAKLLRVLQERKITRVGENRPRSIDVRVVSATHKNLLNEVRLGRFREDLYFRLNVVQVTLAPLRERREDIVPLADYFLSKFAKLHESAAQSFSEDVIEFFLTHSWRGNVRELENKIESATVLCPHSCVTMEHVHRDEDRDFGQHLLPGDEFRVPIGEDLKPLSEIVQLYVDFAIARNGGAKDRTAKELGIDRKTLYKHASPRAPFVSH
jgi:two-component system response regulator HydG